MRSKLSINLFLALALVTASTSTAAIAAGRTNQSVPNSVLNGKGAPTSKIGINGDFYIDVLNFNIYGPKEKNRWPVGVSLRGPSGNDGKDGEKGAATNGADGSRGAKGDSGAQGLQGEKGERGEKGEKGDKGDPGERGATGAQGLTGAAGLTGATGLTGAQGLKGDKGDIGLTGATGLTGTQGLKGDKGDTGATGATGPAGATGSIGATGATGTTGATGAQGAKGDKGDTGATGATGATGPSAVSAGNLVFANTLKGTAGVSQATNEFANLEAGKSYLFDLFVYGYSQATDLYLNFTVSAIGQTPTITTYWLPGKSTSYRGNSAKTEFVFVGKAAVNGSSTIANYQLAITIASGMYISDANAVTLAGGFTGILVGSVSS